MTWFVWEGVSTMGFGIIRSNGFIVAYALLIGANNLQMGKMTAPSVIMQPLK